EGLLAHANLVSAIPRLSISVAALSVSLSMMVAIAVMIGSFRETVVYWVGQTLKADLFIGAGIRPTVGSEQTVSQDVIDTLAKHPQVAALDQFRNVDLIFEGNLAVLGAGSYDVVLNEGSLLFKSPGNARDEMRRAIGQDAVIVSEPFAMRYHKQAGEMIDIPTPQGVHQFRIAAIYYDYASDRGVVILDRGTFRKYFGDLP